ncbi:non-ribosomal peptide synthetase [Streptomyces sp. M19]
MLHRHTGQPDLLIGLDAPSFTAPEETPGPREPGPAGARAAPVPLRVRLRPDAPSPTNWRASARPWPTPSAPLPNPPAPGGDTRRDRTGARPSLHAAMPDVALVVDSAGTGTTLALRYNASLFTRATAAWTLAHCHRLLREALAAPAPRPRPARTGRAGRRRSWRLPVPDGYADPPPPSPARRWSTGCAARSPPTARARRHRARGHPDLRGTGPAHHRHGPAAAPLLRPRQARRAAVRARHRRRRRDLVGAQDRFRLRTAGPRQPDGRLLRLLADADVSAIVSDPDLVGRASSLARGTPSSRSTRPPTPPAGPSPGDAPHSPGDADALAYLLHTSGSTGKPKAVAQTQAGVLAHALRYASRIRIGPGDQVPLLARYTFDAAVMDLYAALLTGATLHVLDPLAAAPELRARIGAAGATLLHGTPTLFRHLLGDLPEDTGPADALASVRTVVLGGEEATEHDLRRFLDAFPAAARWSTGSARPSAPSSSSTWRPRPTSAERRCPSATPWRVRVRLVDEDGRPTEVVGELEIHSGLLAQGYWNQPGRRPRSRHRPRRNPPLPHRRPGPAPGRRSAGLRRPQGPSDQDPRIPRRAREVEAVLRGHPTVAEAVLTVDTRAAAPAWSATSPRHRLPAGHRRTPAVPRAHRAGLRRPLARPRPRPAAAGPDRQGRPRPAARARGRRRRRRRAAETRWSGPPRPVVPRPRHRVRDLEQQLHGQRRDSIRMLTLLTAVRDELGAEVPLIEFLAAPTITTLVKLIERETSC